MSGHTKGPWHRNIKPASKYPTVFAGRNTHVAYVATSGLSEAEIEANINLMAAAPDLLEALEIAKLALAGTYAITDYPSIPDSPEQLALNQVRAAIKKARGV